MTKSLQDLLVVSDLDGTLLTSSEGLPGCNAAMIRLFSALGGRFTIATGRSPASARRALNGLPLGAPAIVFNGGMLYDYEKDAAAAGCDTYVTADLSYHQFLDARAVNLIDAGHFPTEDPVCLRLVEYLQSQFPSLSIQKSASHREVIQYYVKGV